MPKRRRRSVSTIFNEMPPVVVVNAVNGIKIKISKIFKTEICKKNQPVLIKS